MVIPWVLKRNPSTARNLFYPCEYSNRGLDHSNNYTESIQYKNITIMMDTVTETLKAIQNTYVDRLKIPSLQIRELRGVLGIASRRTLVPIITILKRLCMLIKIEMDGISTCKTDCQSRRTMCQEHDILCDVHLEWIQRFDTLSIEQQDEEINMFDEIDNCPECNDYIDVPDCMHECIVSPAKRRTITFVSKQLSTIVQVDKDWIIFIVWYCYTQICSKNMLRTAGVIERLLLGVEHEEFILRLNSEIQTFRLYSQCPMI
jgi:hypothetical protein